MPAKLKKVGNRFRVVGEDNRPVRSGAGVAADAGGLSEAAAKRLRDRINAAAPKEGKAKKRSAPENLGIAIGKNIRRLAGARK